MTTDKDVSGGPASGATLRDMFAAKAMQAIIFHENKIGDEELRLSAREEIAIWSFEMADAMIRARKEQP